MADDLLAACRAGDASKALAILELQSNEIGSIDLNRKDASGFALLHFAAARMDGPLGAEVIVALLNRGAIVDITTAGGETPLHMACANSHYDTVYVLLTLGRADTNLTTSTGGHTPLHFACGAKGRGDIVRALLEYRADVNIAANNGATPLHVNAACNNLETLAVLLSARPQLLARNKEDKTPIQIAMENNHRECAMLMAMALAQIHGVH